MSAVFCIIAFTAVLTVCGAAAELVAIAVGYIDPWDIR